MQEVVSIKRGMFLEVQGNQVKSTAFSFSKRNKQLSHNFLFICWVLKETKIHLLLNIIFRSIPCLFKMNYGIRFRYKMWNENSNYSHICGLKSDLAAVYGHFLTNITRTYFIKRGVSKLIGAFIRDILPELNKNRK